MVISKEKYNIAIHALWKIAVDYHEDNPARHLNPVSPSEVAEKALVQLGEIKYDRQINHP